MVTESILSHKGEHEITFSNERKEVTDHFKTKRPLKNKKRMTSTKLKEENRIR